MRIGVYDFKCVAAPGLPEGISPYFPLSVVCGPRRPRAGTQLGPKHTFQKRRLNRGGEGGEGGEGMQ